MQDYSSFHYFNRYHVAVLRYEYKSKAVNIMLKVIKSLRNTISVSSLGLKVNSGGTNFVANWKDVKKIESVGYSFAQTLGIHIENRDFIYARGRIEEIKFAVIKLAADKSDTLIDAIVLDLKSCYPSERFLDEIGEKYGQNISEIRHLLSISSFHIDACKIKTLIDLFKLIEVLENAGQARAFYVENHISSELIAFEEFFDKVEKTPLTEEQRKACVVCDDRQLLIAAAGSGKSSTLVAKIGYMLEKGWILPSQVVALAFNKGAASEILERCEKRLSTQLSDSKIQASTFHRFGLDLIGKISDSKPSTADWVTDDKIRLRSILAIVMDLISREESYARGWNILVQLKKAKDIKPKVIAGKDGKLRTLQGELVASVEEVNICDFLFVHGIVYEYERPYEFECSDAEHRQYKPDFYYPTIGVYHEHFAIDANGNAPKKFKGYLEKTEWRRNVHKSNSTKFFETLSADFPSAIYDKILFQLNEFGYDFETLRYQQSALGTIELDDPVIKEIDRYVLNRKSSLSSQDQILSRANLDCPYLKEAVLLAEAVLDRYNQMLQSDNSIDYADMIKLPTKLIRDNPIDLGIRMILIDEFQDLSPDRAILIKSILDACPGCKLFGVGDDWQAINGFAGSDLQLMLKFHEFFGKGTTQYLTKTFRSNQGICDVASRFVTTNPGQLKKSVDAIDKNDQGVVEIHFINHADEYVKWLKWIEGSFSSTEKIYALARYNSQKESQTNSRFEDVWGNITSFAKLKPWGRNFECLSFHKSKGLEADTVIIMSSLDEKEYSKGFPSTRNDSPFVQLSTQPKESFIAAEERRLFYVALTRAKKRVIIPVPTFGASPFVYEIMVQSPKNVKIYSNGIQTGLCPKCKKGVKTLANGKFGEYLCCTNSPECSWYGSKADLDKFVNVMPISSTSQEVRKPEWLTRLAKISKEWVEYCYVEKMSWIPTVLRIDPKHGDWDIASKDERYPPGVIVFDLPYRFSRRYLANSHDLFSNWARKSYRAKSTAELNILKDTINEYFSILGVKGKTNPELSPQGIFIDGKDHFYDFLSEVPHDLIKSVIQLILDSDVPVSFVHKVAELHSSKSKYIIGMTNEASVAIYSWMLEACYIDDDEYEALREKHIENMGFQFAEMIDSLNAVTRLEIKWGDSFRLPPNDDEYIDKNIGWKEFASKDREWQLTAIRVAASRTYCLSLCAVSTFINAPDDFDILNEAKSEKMSESWNYWSDKKAANNVSYIYNFLGPLAWRLARLQGLI